MERRCVGPPLFAFLQVAPVSDSSASKPDLLKPLSVGTPRTMTIIAQDHSEILAHSSPDARSPARRCTFQLPNPSPSRQLEDVLRRLRSYQSKAYQAALKSIADKGPRFVHTVSLPTGAGKTPIAAACAFHHLLGNDGAQVLWIAPQWPILQQAAETAEMWFPSLKSRMARAGGSFGELPLAEKEDADLVFTTLPSWYSRSKTGRPWLIGGRRQLIVLDESHWAHDAKQGERLRRACLGIANVLGLSATPEPHSRSDRIVFRRFFVDLCPRDGRRPQYLATPKVLSVETGVVWDPLMRCGEIAARSLRELARRMDRNELIVATIARSLRDGRFTRAIVFACNKNHANALRNLLERHGVSAAAIHSGISEEDQQSGLRALKTGTIQVAVTCTMLATGIDVPDVDGIVLARPSGSLTLLAQMIGRGARLTDTKRHFWIVEFSDKLRDQYKKVFHATDYLESADVERIRLQRSRPRRPRKHAEPKSEPRFERVKVPGLPGLSFAAGQTFGVELEIGYESFSGRPNAKWMEYAREVLACLHQSANWPVARTPGGYHQYSNHTRWQVTMDASCGLEVVSPILVDAAGFEELAEVCKALTRLLRQHEELQVDHHCGLHVTLATRLNTEKLRRAFLKRYSRLEAGLYTLVSPSRLYGFDGEFYRRRLRSAYCAPIRELPVNQWESAICRRRKFGRYRSLNCTKASGNMRLLEVRMHQGTTDYRKIIPWISLWMAIFNHERYHWHSEPILGPIFRGGNQSIRQDRADNEDIFRLLFDEGICLDRELVELLKQRRRDLRPYWGQALRKRVSGWERGGWYRRDE